MAWTYDGNERSFLEHPTGPTWTGVSFYIGGYDAELAATEQGLRHLAARQEGGGGTYNRQSCHARRTQDLAVRIIHLTRTPYGPHDELHRGVTGDRLTDRYVRRAAW